MLDPVDVDGVDVVEVESELIAVRVEAFIFGVVEGGVPLEQRDDAGVIVACQCGGEFAGLFTGERGVGVREVQGRFGCGSRSPRRRRCGP